MTTRQAAAFLVAQSLVGLAVLLRFNGFTVALGIAALLPVAVYPFMKRITNWPQFVLGLAFAWGALVGWSATAGSLAWPALALYAGAILWTMGYDTIYALQDIADDVGAGIGSTAIQFGARVRGGVAALYALALGAIGAALAGAGVGPWAWAGFAGFAAHLAWQASRIRRDDTARALALFRSNRDAGLILFAGLAVQAWASAAADGLAEGEHGFWPAPTLRPSRCPARRWASPRPAGRLLAANGRRAPAIPREVPHESLAPSGRVPREGLGLDPPPSAAADPFYSVRAGLTSGDAAAPGAGQGSDAAWPRVGAGRGGRSPSSGRARPACCSATCCASTASTSSSWSAATAPTSRAASAPACWNGAPSP